MVNNMDHGLPKFSLLGYDDWKIMMEAHHYALHDCMWMVLEEGPLKIQMENPERDPNNPDQGLGKLCERSEDLKNPKIEVLLEKFKNFKMLPGESFDLLDERFHKILNDLALLNHVLFPKEKNVRKPGHWRSACPYPKVEKYEEGERNEKKEKTMVAAKSDESSNSSSDEEALVCMERRIEKSNHEDRSTMLEDETLCLIAKDDVDEEKATKYPGYSLEFCKDMVSLKSISTNEVILTGKRIRNIYEVMWEKVKEAYLISKGDTNLLRLWHKRLSHLNFDTRNKLSKEGLVEGLPKVVYKNESICDACKKGKQVKSTFKAKPAHSTTRILSLIHMDLFGPVTPISLSGKQYVLVVVDDYSRYTWTIFLNSKKETKGKLTNCMKLIQNQATQTIQKIRSDQGTEFLNEIIIHYFDKPSKHDHEVLDLSDKDKEVNEGDRMKPMEFIPFGSLPLKTSRRNPDSYWAEPTEIHVQPSETPNLSHGDNSGNAKKGDLKNDYELLLELIIGCLECDYGGHADDITQERAFIINSLISKTQVNWAKHFFNSITKHIGQPGHKFLFQGLYIGYVLECLKVAADGMKYEERFWLYYLSIKGESKASSVAKEEGSSNEVHSTTLKKASKKKQVASTSPSAEEPQNLERTSESLLLEYQSTSPPPEYEVDDEDTTVFKSIFSNPARNTQGGEDAEIANMEVTAETPITIIEHHNEEVVRDSLSQHISNYKDEEAEEESFKTSKIGEEDAGNEEKAESLQCFHSLPPPYQCFTQGYLKVLAENQKEHFRLLKGMTTFTPGHKLDVTLQYTNLPENPRKPIQVTQGEASYIPTHLQLSDILLGAQQSNPELSLEHLSNNQFDGTEAIGTDVLHFINEGQHKERMENLKRIRAECGLIQGLGAASESSRPYKRRKT
ncbi:unnamed protein product [Cuscuta campestris]|uniref:Integrase catalytic domain-containing protein n=1 Tax=Cuscuta campestris TaxID=132261 RepID=A0A484KPX3_9ASTE|nr:unnamed protein product [Cuscuta campestris]